MTVAVAVTAGPASAGVIWTDWKSATNGEAGSAYGEINVGGTTVEVNYSGDLAFAQTNGGTDYWRDVDGTAPDPYTNTAEGVSRPTGTDILAVYSGSVARTLAFSESVSNLLFAVNSLNANGFVFTQDFEILSSSGPGNRGFWGYGVLSKDTSVPGQYRLVGTGEGHGVIRFLGTFDTLTWTSSANEYWHGYTVGVEGLATPTVPEPGTLALMGLGSVGMAFAGWRKKRKAALAA